MTGERELRRRQDYDYQERKKLDYGQYFSLLREKVLFVRLDVSEEEELINVPEPQQKLPINEAKHCRIDEPGYG